MPRKKRSNCASPSSATPSPTTPLPTPSPTTPLLPVGNALKTTVSSETTKPAGTPSSSSSSPNPPLPSTSQQHQHKRTPSPKKPTRTPMPVVDGAEEEKGVHRRPPLSLIDLGFLTEDERGTILEVLKRDEDLRKSEEVRVKKLKTELHELRKKAAVNPDDENSNTNGCARCHEEFGLFGSGSQCPKCKHNVCPKCQIFTPTGKRWLCTVCHKGMQIKIESGEWFYEKLEVAEKVTLFGSDLVKASLAKAKGDPSNPPKLTIDDLRPSSSAESTPRTKHRVRHRRTNSNPKDLRNYRHHADSASDRDSGWSQHNGASLDASESSQRSSLHDDESHQRSSSIHSSTGSEHEHVNSDDFEPDDTTGVHRIPIHPSVCQETPA
ncbi:uncharacterized protein [Amphiura filiformis]|uniref:uncharacterized protein isoform X2 n=1 Tax=Amphiura filiformis TaxID=82378 RepID=UPI003B22444A